MYSLIHFSHINTIYQYVYVNYWNVLYFDILLCYSYCFEIIFIFIGSIHKYFLVIFNYYKNQFY